MSRKRKGPSRPEAVERPSDPGMVLRQPAKGLTTISFNFSELPPPHREYDADFAWVKPRFGALSLFFGKAHLDEPQTLRSRIELKMAPDRFVRAFGTSVRDEFADELSKAVERRPNDSSLSDIKAGDMRLVGDKDHSEWVTAAYIARTGGQGSLDFYSISPRDAAMAKEGLLSRIPINPVVRVNLSVGELSRLLTTCRSLVSEVNASLPQEERDDD
jgi:hypothetical protein